MRKVFNESFYGYAFNGVVDEDNNAKYSSRVVLITEDALYRFLCATVATHPEIRITDAGDNLVMHIVRQELRFPVPGFPNNVAPPGTNKWIQEEQRFVSLGDTDEHK